jgi:hypothetical protein
METDHRIEQNSDWVRALPVPMHLGLIDGLFVPQNLMPSHDSPVLVLSSRLPHTNILWVQEKGAQISMSE